MKIEFLKCNTCGKCVSSGFIACPTEMPDEGIVIRAWIECPECIGREYADSNSRSSDRRGARSVKERSRKGLSKDTKVP